MPFCQLITESQGFHFAEHVRGRDSGLKVDVHGIRNAYRQYSLALNTDREAHQTPAIRAIVVWHKHTKEAVDPQKHGSELL